MATRVDLTTEQTRAALEQYVASVKRGMNTTKNPAFKPIYEKDMATYQNAINTLTETK